MELQTKLLYSVNSYQNSYFNTTNVLYILYKLLDYFFVRIIITTMVTYTRQHRCNYRYMVKTSEKQVIETPANIKRAN